MHNSVTLPIRQSRNPHVPEASSGYRVQHPGDKRPKEGLYDPRNEHDACGVGFVVDIKNRESHDVIRDGLQILANLTHRGAVGADPLAGDGAGILIQTPDAFLREECRAIGIDLPKPGGYGVAMVFLPQADDIRATCEALLAEKTMEEGQILLGWRDVPVDSALLGESVKPIEPVIRQAFIAKGAALENHAGADTGAFERKLYVIRRLWHRAVRALPGTADAYVPSLSSRTLLYKGMVLAENLSGYYLDLNDARMESALALVHQRFSTNTFPSWELAQPFRYLCHNGEINTLRGNINWMRARRHSMKSVHLGADLKKLWPVVDDDASDSATFDNALELLVAGGYSLTHAMMLMIPEAWQSNPLMDEKRRAFYEYHAGLMEPWDGPATIAFTDGRQIGATLDRNGLRPARYIVTKDGRVIMGSEVGVLPIPEENIAQKWRLQPGKMFLIDLEEGRIVDDVELKDRLASSHPYQEWLDNTQIRLEDIPNRKETAPDPDLLSPDGLPGEQLSDEWLLARQQAFGYTQEDAKFFLKPMVMEGQDPIGAMGRDIPPAVLSHHPKVLYDYFRQNFAQVTNPPIDPIREELVMSLLTIIGPRPNLLGLQSGGGHQRLEALQPILSNRDLARIRHIENHLESGFRSETISICYPVARQEANEEGAPLGAAPGMEGALGAICERAKIAIEHGCNIIILSDREMDADHMAIPALLATGAVYHHLVREGLRTEVGLVVETGEAKRVHDFCLLAGYGAEAINPYLAFDTISAFVPELPGTVTEDDAHKTYIKAVGKGMLKVMSKMGISTYQSYCGAQIFDAVGLSSSFVDRYFAGTHTTIEGVGIDEIALETLHRHQIAFADAGRQHNALDVGGELAWRATGERHMWTPETITLAQKAVRAGDRDTYQQYEAAMNAQGEDAKNLRGLFTLKFLENPIPLDQVEPASEIVKRFSTGAMSFGSISWEAHTTIAIAMNRLGAKSNTGEGGEEASRYTPMENGDSMRSATKQVASGRFGVTTEYLVNADAIQIKMAQGAKPGEGGQLPGHKVNEWIGRVRHSIPGVGLISPPPHHDIYSIEDLAQLIHDLKNVNPRADISVKLVSEVGVGTVAAGVSKAHAEHVTISGDEGGTGASPLTSTQNAGSHWEIGLAETHQTLVRNDLRGRIAVQVDGGIRTGRDVVIGALLGADEFGFGTLALIAVGCIMMRKCHLNTCPVGVATQDEKLRKLFPGQPEHLVNFMRFIAEEVRETMAKLGFRRFDDMIGQSDRLDMRRAIEHEKAKGLDYSRILRKPEPAPGVAIHHCEPQDHGLEKALDHSLIRQAKPALEEQRPVKIRVPVLNVNRTVGAMLSGEVAKRYGHAGLPDDTITIQAKGTGGQSFGAFLAHGITIRLLGETNDYVGKGLSGGKIIVTPPPESTIVPEDNIIIGNTVLYGATGGQCYFRGVAGERFGVRNSGAIAIVEGVGDHGCEYMTGGVVVVLGGTGRNFAAGMSGGIAYVLDEKGDFRIRYNPAMVELEPITEDDADKDAMIRLKEGGRGAPDEFSDEPLGELPEDMLRHDALRLGILIERHVHYTDSERGKMILSKWDEYLPRFVKVMPVEFRRVLEDLAKQ
uniref:Glutamate synthase [NADPH] large chain n=1 Tax=Candidatus Kentrum eta TaxID=2126337 RepID=A0A450UTJ5_9GAMM|nr:MAG: glutamate synthase (NADPH/NADH) large chain [Candidatus Kentron sp. H]VFJ95770.1 MAG: glutamate synthase (NADPH/NADH) large chain [Candidatus Kentron sp. H]VFK01975.1 MAG: glutamate synthase (NADPH/NADH) large chain [Candidatus Kentron sp. H]